MVKSVSISKYPKGLLTTARKLKRKDYNTNYDKKRTDVIEIVNVLDPSTGKMKAVTRIKEGLNLKYDFETFSDPDAVPLDQCVSVIEISYGGELTVRFKDDASTEEINKVVEILQSELK